MGFHLRASVYDCGILLFNSGQIFPDMFKVCFSLSFYKVNKSTYSVEIPTRCSFVIEFIILWNNKFYYKAASYWYFYSVIYDARIHEYEIYLQINTI